MQDATPVDASGVERLTALLDELKRLVDWLHGRVASSSDAERDGHDAADSGLTGKGFLHTLKLMLARVLDDPGSLASHYGSFAGLVLDAAQQKLDLEPEPGDRRFKDPLWRSSPLHRMLLQVYLGWQRTLGEGAALHARR